MSPDKWEEIKTNIRKQFTVEEQDREDLHVTTGEGEVKIGEAEYVVFESPLGRMKLQFGTKARLEDKKYHFSHRAGQSARVEYRFSDAETVHTFKCFKWDDQDDNWKEIESSSFTNH